MKLVRNSIPKQTKQGNQRITIKEWNDIINVLREQTNTNTKALSEFQAVADFDELLIIEEPPTNTYGRLVYGKVISSFKK